MEQIIKANVIEKVLYKCIFSCWSVIYEGEFECSYGIFRFSFKVDGEAKHLKIKPLEISGKLKFYGSGQLFDGLQQLIAFYKGNPILKSRKGAKIRLTETVLPETRM